MRQACGTWRFGSGWGLRGSQAAARRPAVQVLTAVEERDAAVADTEHHAGAALPRMTELEDLTLREAVEWCGEAFFAREATRLRRLAVDNSDAEGAPRVSQPIRRWPRGV